MSSSIIIIPMILFISSISSVNAKCAAIYIQGTYGSMPIFDLGLCVPARVDGLDVSNWLTCNEDKDGAILEIFETTDCSGDAAYSEDYDVGDFVECEGRQCSFGLFREYTDWDCSNESFIELPIITGECLKISNGVYRQYECDNYGDLMHVMEYPEADCKGDASNDVKSALFNDKCIESIKCGGFFSNVLLSDGSCYMFGA
eukprot:262373_1